MQRFLIYLFLQTLYMFKAVPSLIIRSTQLYIQLQVLSTNIAAFTSQQQYWLKFLKLYIQLCAPDDVRRNSLKHVELL